MSPALLRLLKNDVGHSLITIGAGVQCLSISPEASRNHTGQLAYFSVRMICTLTVSRRIFPINVPTRIRVQNATTFLNHIRWHRGGHIYPLMRTAELLLPKITAEGQSAEDVIAHYGSPALREREEFKDICRRILPMVSVIEMRLLFFSHKEVDALKQLERKGFVNEHGAIVSKSVPEEMRHRRNRRCCLLVWRDSSRLLCWVDVVPTHSSWCDFEIVCYHFHADI
mmetsp:Transcript_23876/g.39472  ORF Transcript_23876/g.39472 Transcript_23876/m.39472 type:complete len:226 (+) Transcript_23876:168-845(+)